MISYVYDRTDELVAWAEERIPGTTFRDDRKAIGMERHGRLVAVVVYDTFSSSNCFVSLASDGSKRWLAREFITRALIFPFVQCGMHRISALVSAENADSQRFTRHFGWVEEGVAREGGRNREDLTLFGMLRRECPFPLPMLPFGADSAV